MNSYPAEGLDTIKKVGKHEYLYNVIASGDKQEWQIVVNVKDLDPKDPNLTEAKV